VETYKLLLHPKHHLSGLTCAVAKTVEDALIVSFCTHARNLLEFFSKPGRDRYHAAARDYANTCYEPHTGDAGRLYGQLCAPINHLTYNRTDDDNKKNWPPGPQKTRRDHPPRGCSVGRAPIRRIREAATSD
jgi:hypothetical protein